MKRTQLLSLLQSYKPTHEEAQFYQQIVTFVHTYEDCFDRSLSIGHITASAWLVNKDNTHVLLMHHAKLNKWVQFGGHCDGNPDVLAVTIKEAREESGIQNIEPVHTTIFDIDVHLIPARAHEPEHFHYDIRFLLRAISDEPVIQNHESKALCWFEKNRALLPTEERSVTRMFEKWIYISL